MSIANVSINAKAALAVDPTKASKLTTSFLFKYILATFVFAALLVVLAKIALVPAHQFLLAVAIMSDAMILLLIVAWAYLAFQCKLKKSI